MQVNIAVFGKNKEIVDTLERVINKNEMWKAYCSCTEIELQSFWSLNRFRFYCIAVELGKES